MCLQMIISARKVINQDTVKQPFREMKQCLQRFQGGESWASGGEQQGAGEEVTNHAGRCLADGMLFQMSLER